MKRSLALGFLIALFSLSVHAATNSQKVILSGPIQVGTATLPAGDCKLTWTGTGANAQLTLQARGQKPVTVAVDAVEKKSTYHAVQTNKVNGVEVLQSIILEKVTFDLKPAPVSGN
jgi:hypothetical protein